MIKRRNMLQQVVLFVLTFGIYGVYWFYDTSREMLEYNGRTGRPLLWAAGLFIPYVGFISIWFFSRQIEEATDGKYNVILMFVGWLVFPPVVWFVLQRELNAIADQQAVETWDDPEEIDDPPDVTGDYVSRDLRD